VFKLVKLGFGLVALAAVAWFGVTVKLGPRTLFQHLRAIGQTKESQDLVDGTKQAAAPIVDDVRSRISGTPEASAQGKTDGKADSKAEGAPQERLSDSEQRQLRELLRKVDRAAP